MNQKQLTEASDLQISLENIDVALGELSKLDNDWLEVVAADEAGTGLSSDVAVHREELVAWYQALRASRVARLQALGVEL
jgi:hypothetical protein